MAASRVLLLGGTGEARELAAALAADPDFHVVSSLAGRSAAPVLPDGEVRIGGFAGASGLAEWLREHAIDVLVDATHPFATRMSAAADRAARAAGIPLLFLRRPGWRAQHGDDWHLVSTMDEAAAALPGFGRRVFLSIGRQEVSAFAGLRDHEFVARCLEPPDEPRPSRLTVLLERGPFSRADELSLLREHRIQVLVTKNSGGTATSAKLHACRELGMPVLMVRRPPAPEGVPRARTVRQALDWLRDQPPRDP
ncbi:precorrin-6A/cobalt-precorrin-6A reductase [Tamaricihabitans halophyticus]|uniref:Precorrin-6A/cobalt-precorrin-6A reductase n=1 Tax=Tamaricihabitans halophyticus TaxID=1262583 RepID=A0A4R2QKN9_9PSEU|nr:cobalt-precorrin-6A reductase [Tamaricihabitans halophyticus]TCP50010.1 precorrin-6A/cobalt-precorrin-6A reductase [Tamaricihabitans halophyticus]